ncbi:MAG TPA: NUDIX domain-containing protein [Acidimicrobiia bacterium]|nr:NUDIX domain-containing protein [Acidimicrobiia bacterium]
MNGPIDLEALVLAHERGDDESSLVLAIEALQLAKPMWRRSEFVPGHFTASGFVASPDGSALLLIHHARLGRWLQPGGHIESEDGTVDEAARREIAEETGIASVERLGVGLVRIDAHPIPPHADEPPHMHFDLAVGYRAASWDIGPTEGVVDARWVPLDTLSEFPTDDSVRRGAVSLRRLLLDGARRG